MKSYGIIFDCDGTLVDSLSQALESFNQALLAVGEQARSPEQIKAYFGAGADRILMRIIGDEARGLEAFQHYMDHQSRLAAQTHLHPGVRELLDLLAQEQVPMAVVTGRHERDLEVVLEPHSLADYFVTLIADNHAPNSKPAPDGVLMAAERMGLAPQRTFYVGDATFDLQAAHGAGAVPVAALWDPLVKRDEMLATRPACMAEKPLDIWNYYRERFLGDGA